MFFSVTASSLGVPAALRRWTRLRPIVIVSVLFVVLAGPVGAQDVDVLGMSMKERKAHQSQIQAEATAHYERLLERVGVARPDSLPPPADDPSRPDHIFKDEESGNWTDEQGRFYVRSAWGNWTNYHEDGVGDYTLSDPLTLNRGASVDTEEAWWTQRRPEIRDAYMSKIYGAIPENTPGISYEVTDVDSSALGGRALKKTITGTIDNSRYPETQPRILFTLHLPKEVTTPVPVIVQAAWGFERFGPPPEGPTPKEQVIDKGWAFVTFNTTALQPDHAAGLDEGIIGLMNEGDLREPGEWGVLAAWSWGLSRILDYLETVPAVDATRAGVQGHSRWGKTALLAAALDRRWAVAFPSCSGAMGASLEKRDYGETIDIVASTNEYHWMAGHFLNYAGNWDAMPVDAHLLISLVAPRPLFLTGATEDHWTDQRGMFLAATEAAPVYEFLGADGLSVDSMPPPDSSAIGGDLAWRMHEGGHTALPDWPVFLEFAERYLEPK